MLNITSHQTLMSEINRYTDTNKNGKINYNRLFEKRCLEYLKDDNLDSRSIKPIMDIAVRFSPKGCNKILRAYNKKIPDLIKKNPLFVLDLQNIDEAYYNISNMRFLRKNLGIERNGEKKDTTGYEIMWDLNININRDNFKKIERLRNDCSIVTRACALTGLNENTIDSVQDLEFQSNIKNGLNISLSQQMANELTSIKNSNIAKTNELIDNIKQFYGDTIYNDNLDNPDEIESDNDDDTEFRNRLRHRLIKDFNLQKPNAEQIRQLNVALEYFMDYNPQPDLLLNIIKDIKKEQKLHNLENLKVSVPQFNNNQNPQPAKSTSANAESLTSPQLKGNDELHNDYGYQRTTSPMMLDTLDEVFQAERWTMLIHMLKRARQQFLIANTMDDLVINENPNKLSFAKKVRQSKTTDDLVIKENPNKLSFAKKIVEEKAQKTKDDSVLHKKSGMKL